VDTRREQFTYDYYTEFVSRLREVYRFVTFREGKGDQGADGPLLIMRHDIDSEVEAAARMAAMEKSLGIQSTYFFMVRCPLYNPFCGDGAEQVRQILACGHHFGLHFDCALYPDTSASSLNRYVSKECELLEQFFEHPVEAVSFHRPGDMELGGVELERWPNSYEKVFLEKFEYFSDSRGRWARGNPLESEAFAIKKNLQVLVHPLWWTVNPTTPYERLLGLVAQIRERTEQYISENCQVWDAGRRSRGDEGDMDVSQG